MSNAIDFPGGKPTNNKEQFLQRWSTDYLQSKQQRQRRQRTSPNLQPGGLVLQREDNTTTSYWLVPENEETHLLKDGIVQVVKSEGSF